MRIYISQRSLFFVIFFILMFLFPLKSKMVCIAFYWSCMGNGEEDHWKKNQRNVMDSISSQLRQLCVLSDDKCYEVCIRDFDMTLVWQISYSDKDGS